MSKYLENVIILKNEKISNNIYLMKILSENLLNKEIDIKSGQFYMLKLRNEIRILKRPISVHSFNQNGEIEFMYKILGEGTEELSNLKEGNYIEIQGPLGNGFEILDEKENILIIGAGIGIAPLKELIKDLENKKITFIAGARNKEELKVLDNFNLENVNTILTTDDGSLGRKANVIEVLNEYIKYNKIDLIYACGPDKVLEYIIEISNKNNILSQVSLEERMACGVGACVVCSKKTKLGMKKVCQNGPIFYAHNLGGM